MSSSHRRRTPVIGGRIDPLWGVANRVAMAVPTDADRIVVLRRFHFGLAHGADANQLVADIADLHIPNNTFPGEVFMELSADALNLAGLDTRHRIDYCALIGTELAEAPFRGKEHRRIQYAILTAFAVHGGLQPDLLDEVAYWIDRYWQYALLAAVAIVRACAKRADLPIERFAAELATRHAITID